VEITDGQLLIMLSEVQNMKYMLDRNIIYTCRLTCLNGVVYANDAIKYDERNKKRKTILYRPVCIID